MLKTELLDLIKRIKSIADIGKLYSKNEFDAERYAELNEISIDMLGLVSGHDTETLKAAFPPVTDYPTAKVDIRGILLSADNRILLVKESADGRWSLPGGWGDIGYTPSEIIVKEFKEETGLEVTVKRLLAVFDKKMHPHPPQPFYVYKMVFLCESVSAELITGFDVLDAGYFEIDKLPELSEDRILKSQIDLLYKEYVFTEKPTYFD